MSRTASLPAGTVVAACTPKPPTLAVSVLGPGSVAFSASFALAAKPNLGRLPLRGVHVRSHDQV